MFFENCKKKMFFSYLEQLHSIAVLGSIYSKANAQCNFWAFPNPITIRLQTFFCLCAIYLILI